jgi:hypothetical protein
MSVELFERQGPQMNAKLAFWGRSTSPRVPWWRLVDHERDLGTPA